MLSDIEAREKEERTESDTSPVPVKSFNVDDRTGKPVVGRESNHEPLHQANQKFKKQKEIMIARGNPLSADSGRASSQSGCKNSVKIWWMMKFLNGETHTPVLLMK